MEKHAIRARRKAANKVRKCFDKVNWTKNVFVSNGETLKDTEGNTKFYPADDIDDAIKKLNKVLNKLSS